MIRKMLEIKGQQYDLWEIKSIETYQEFPEFADDWEYGIQLNREGIATNLNAIRIACDDEVDMKQTLAQLKIKLSDSEHIEFL